MNSRNLINLVLSLLLFLLFALACSGSASKQTTGSTSGTPSPTPSATQAASGTDTEKDDENERLKKKVEDLKKKVDQQQKTPPPVKQAAPPTQSSATIAQVNSPSDGFLALRSDPSSNVGYRILQIPHGSYVQVLGCQGFAERVAGRSGRWCRVNYGGYTGWAFDGWLVY